MRLLPRIRPALLAFGLLSASVMAAAQVSSVAMPLDSGFGPLDTSQPPIPVQQLIQEFAAKESQFKQALQNYTYTRSVKVDTINDDGKPDGEYYQVVDIGYDTSGRRTEHVVEAPESTLTRIIMSPSDFSDIEERLPFVLTSEDIGQYDLNYLGKQKVDQVDTFVFEVRPKVIEKKHRYFQGRIWVDQVDHQIVVTDGKNVPDDLRRGHEDLSLPFITFRQQVDGKYWFPVYTHGDAVLHFPAGSGYLSQNVHMAETVKYTDYKRFGTSVRMIFDGQEVGSSDSNQPKNGQGQQPQPSNPHH
jgi:hypothetical protein